MRMMPSDVVTAHAEYSDWPTKYRLSNTFTGSACQLSRASVACAPPAPRPPCGAGVALSEPHVRLNRPVQSDPAAIFAAAMCVSGVSPCAESPTPRDAAASAARNACFMMSRILHARLGYDPRRHRPLVRYDGRLDGIQKAPAEFLREIDEERFVDEVPFAAVREERPAAGNGAHFAFDADGRGEPGPKHPARLQHAPHLAHHRLELRVVSREVQNGAAEHDVCRVVRKRHTLDRRDDEVVRG